MDTVRDCANRIYQGLYNIGFQMPEYNYESNSGRYLINQKVMERALDTLQSLCENNNHTADIEFNKNVQKVLGTVFSLLYYYYQGGNRYIDYTMYITKFLLDIQSIYRAADFFRERYVEGQECYLAVLMNEGYEVLLFSTWDSFLKNYTDKYMINPICLLRRGDILKVKRASDENYSFFRFNPDRLITSVHYSVENNKIEARIDNSMWEDSAWNL